MAGQKSRAQLARETAEKLKAQQESSAKKGKIIFTSIISVLVVMLFGVLGYVLYVNGHGNEIASKKAQDELTKIENKPTQWNDDGSFTFSKNGGGKDAEIKGAITVDMYNDFICPSCGNIDRTFGSTFDELLDSGKVNFRFHPLAWFNNTSPLTSESESPTAEKTANGFSDMYSTRAAAAAVYIGEKEPSKYKAFMTEMYKLGNQPCEGYKGKNAEGCSTDAKGYDPDAGSNEKIQEHALAAGVSKEVAEKCTDGTYREWIEATSKIVSSSGKITGTPAFFINDNKWDWVTADQKSSKTPDDFKQAVIAAQ